MSHVRNPMSMTTLVDEYVSKSRKRPIEEEDEDEISSPAVAYECLERGCNEKSAPLKQRGERFATQEGCQAVCTPERWRAYVASSYALPLARLPVDPQELVISRLIGVSHMDDPIFFRDEFRRYALSKQRLAEAPSCTLVGSIMGGLLKRADQHPGILVQLVELYDTLSPYTATYGIRHWSNPQGMTWDIDLLLRAHWTDAMVKLIHMGMHSTFKTIATRYSPRFFPFDYRCTIAAIQEKQLPLLLWIFQNAADAAWPIFGENRHFQEQFLRDIYLTAESTGTEYIKAVLDYDPERSALTSSLQQI